LSAPAQTAPPAEHGGDTIPLPQPLKQKIKDGIVAVSLANLIFLRSTFDMLFDDDRFYNKSVVTATDLLALMFNIFWVAAAIWLGMRAVHRFRNLTTQLALHLAFFSLLLIPADFVRNKFYSITDYQMLIFFKQPVVLLSLAAIIPLVLWQHRRIAIAVAGLLGILSSFAFVILVKIVLLTLGVTHVRECDRGTLAPFAAVRAGQPRVVWMIFDELDYRVVFEQRPAGVELPEFDRVEKETIHASHAYSPGDETLLSMPQAISGVRATNEASGCDLMITPFDTGKPITFNGLPTVFSSARALGFNTALVGWYIPYDHLLSGQLNFCQWYSWPPFESGRGETFAGALHNQLASLAWSFHVRQVYADLSQDSLRTAISVGTNTNYGLVLLHLPPPHRPGIYSATKHKISIWDTIFKMSGVQGYFNNLALADYELGEIRRAMSAAGLWDKTWIIIGADHSWRSSKGFDGKRDLRVPFLVKPPGTTAPSVYSLQFNTILTHDLILAMLRNEVTNQQNVADWLDAHRTWQNFIPAPRNTIQ
jgi:hypothetical protein